jgi:FixJ family two-component response regulator
MPQIDATVLIVDDDAAVRRSLARLVRSAGFAAKTFASPKAFLREELPPGPACVLLDMCMDGLNGLDVQEALRKNARHIPIIFLSGHGTIPDATTSIKHGAEDFLEKPARPVVLLDAIRRAVEHDRLSSTARLGRDEEIGRYHTLTPRERAVMELVVMGLLNKQAAAQLGISEKTVKVHRSRVMDKMQVESLAALVRTAERIGLESSLTGAPVRTAEVEPPCRA